MHLVFMKKIALVALKILVTIFLFYFLIKKIDVFQVINTIKNISFKWAFVAISLMLLQILLAGLRWYWVSAMLNANIKLKKALSFMFIGQFFGQLLPSSIGGDGMRLFMTHKEGIPLGRASSSILCDRGLGLMINIILPVLAYFILPIYWDPGFVKLMHGLNVFASIAIGALLFLYFGQDFIIRILKKIHLIRRVANLIHDMHKVVFTHSHTPRLYAISASVQILSVFIFYSIGRGLHIHLPIESLFIIIPSVMLITVIPLTIAGWGIRESAMVIGLSFIGVSQIQSFAISFTFGLLLIAATLPGFILWIIYKHKK
jgi:uncharacterized protein (TIRG00374 family)